MKRSVYYLLIMQLLLVACSSDSLDNEIATFNDSGSFEAFLDGWKALKQFENNCTSAEDAYQFPEIWTEEDLNKYENLTEETFRSMSTCGLLETLLEHPTNRLLGPWCTHCNDNNLPGVTNFNISLSENLAAVELFEREDFFPVLASYYLGLIKDKKELDNQIRYFEMLLASNLCMQMLSESEKNLLMAMALEKKGSDKDFLTSTPYIMIAIMRTCNYAPFMKDVYPNLVEKTSGYGNLNDYEIIKYAKQFLNGRE